MKEITVYGTPIDWKKETIEKEKPMSEQKNYYDYTADLCVLAELDEGAAYEVDYTLIGYDKKVGKFVLVTASGCSCWDGDCYVEYYDSFADMHRSLGVFGDDREFQPSLKGVERVMKEAMENMVLFPVGIRRGD